MRHADAPGAPGDPAGFRLGDCASQRNLSEAGRAQARRTAAALERQRVAFDLVLTSPWCRCRETALIVTGQEAEPLDALSNLVGRQEQRETQLAALKAYLGRLAPSARVLFVTHGIVIAGLVGITPAQGEMVIVEPWQRAASPPSSAASRQLGIQVPSPPFPRGEGRGEGQSGIMRLGHSGCPSP